MAGTKNTSNEDTAIGCLSLIGLVVLLAVIGFVIEHWEFFLGAAVVIGVVAVIVVAVKEHHRKTIGAERTRAAAAAKARGARAALLQEGRRAGEMDMRTAWLERQLGSLPAQNAGGGTSVVAERLAVIPKNSWNVAQLRMHGQAVWTLRTMAQGTALREQVEARLDRVAAMISDLTDEEFDSRRGQTSDRYLYHQDREVRAAYLEGGAKGVEAIMDTITAARVQAREDAATKAAADAAALQRNAALKALRETQQRTEARDAHAAWEAQAKQIDE